MPDAHSPLAARRSLAARRLLVLLLLAACARAPHAPALTAGEPGTHVYRLPVAGVERSYALHIPPHYDPGVRVPLVLVLHGRRGSGLGIEQVTGMSAQADAAGFIAAYPNARGRAHAWGAESGAGSVDVAFLRALIDTLEGRLPLDTARVFVAGFSSGAVMTYALGAELGSRIAAIAAVAGTVGRRVGGGRVQTVPRPGRALPVIIFHGTEDRTVPYDAEHARRSRFKGALPIAASVAFWVEGNGCDPAPRRDTSSGGRVVHERYRGCRDGADVELYTVVGGGHGWPGASRLAPPTPTLGDTISATSLVWEFFARHH